jgi:hypothetical protein
MMTKGQDVLVLEIIMKLEALLFFWLEEKVERRGLT